jgi:NADH-quinone oxidoreductase subunit I
MSSILKYFSGLFVGIGSLLGGMAVTWKELWTKKVTQQYPENRDTLVISDRFRCELTMPHDENNEHACTACGICQMNCPNGTITVNSKIIETEDGKKKKILDTYIWDLGMCTFCNLCVLTCPSGAIKFDNQFENAVFTRSKLVQQLNHEGSKLREKKKEVKPVEPVVKVKAPVAETGLNTEKPVIEVKAPEVKAEKTVEPVVIVKTPEVKAEQPIASVLAAVKESKAEKPVEPVVIVKTPEIKTEQPISTVLATVKESKTEKPVVEVKAPVVRTETKTEDTKVAVKPPVAETEAKAESTEN